MRIISVVKIPVSLIYGSRLLSGSIVEVRHRTSNFNLNTHSKSNQLVLISRGNNPVDSVRRSERIESFWVPVINPPSRRFGIRAYYTRVSSGTMEANGNFAGNGASRLTDPAQLINDVETFLFDVDGVIWRGGKLIEGVAETLDMLRDMGKKLLFVTNNSTKSRRVFQERFRSLGLDISELSGTVKNLHSWKRNALQEEVFSSSFAAAGYLKSIGFPRQKKVYVVGEEGIQQELAQAGIQHLGGPEDGEKKLVMGSGKNLDFDRDVGAVVVGFDHYINYYKMVYATLCIRENPGCLFIATNCDSVAHFTDQQEWPAGGTMVGSIRASTAREPIVVGKPSTFMMDYLANKFEISKSKMCMVGDRLDTDILFGQAGGCKTLLVLSGVTDLKTLHSPENSIHPDFYTNQLPDLLAAKKPAIQ